VKIIPSICSGQTNGNSLGVIHGTTDEPLNETGEIQASLVANRLKGEHFDKVYSSDLSRAFRTAKAIVDANSSLVNKDAITKDVLLRERHFGRWENSRAADFMDAARAAGYVTPEDIWINFDDETTETTADVTKRGEKFLQNLFTDILSDDGVRSVLVASHGAWIRPLCIYLANTGRVQNFPSPDELRDGATCKNTSITKLMFVLDKDGRDFESALCTELYCAKHLDTPEVQTPIPAGLRY